MRSRYSFSSAVVVSVIVAACAIDRAADDTSDGGAGSGAVGGSSTVAGSGGTPSSVGGSSTGGSVTAGTSTGGSTAGSATGGSATAGTSPGGATGGTPAGGAGSGGGSTGGAGASGASGTGGAQTAGSSGSGASGAGAGGVPTAGAAGDGGSGAGGSGTAGAGGGSAMMGPCDIYAAATPAAPCVGAYSTIRRLRAEYTGPLFQVRSGSNAMNTGSGGQTHDIMQSADGFALSSAVDEVCANTTCTVSLLYDQSGHGNNLPVAKKGRSEGGMYSDQDDFETVISSQGALNVGGKRVYSLFMAARQGYRQTRAGDGVPLGKASQGIYMLADGTHSASPCCWDFGNVSPDPTRYGVMNTLFFGIGYWGKGAGAGPWFMADYEAGVWAGGTRPGDPGWGALEGDHPANPNNPSLKVKFALGFLKTNMTDWSLRMADAGTASTITTAYAGGLPKEMDNEGALVLGVGGDNSNNSYGTFYEGAVLAGFPPDSAEQAVLENIKAMRYGQ